MTRLSLNAGQRFGRLVVVEYAGRKYWLCQCDCGKRSTHRVDTLKSGGARSCGCLNDEKRRERASQLNLSHGHARVRTPTYRSWDAMINRCQRPTSNRWHLYGGRGITVCARWQVFANFLADMGERPEGLTLDRIDVEGNYEQSNCRWATRKEQAENKRTSTRKAVTHGG